MEKTSAAPSPAWPAGSLIWAGIKGLSLLEEEKKSIQEAEISGLILFKRNIETLPQLFELCREIHSLKPAPLIMMDREGGPVDRLKYLPEYPKWPAPADLAQLCSLEEIEQTAFYMAQEMKALGICINFAPCVDILSVPNPLFNRRLWGWWGDGPEKIAQKALMYLYGLKKAGLAGCAKHFPGHGGVREDSHLQLPVDHRDFEELYKCDLIPFQKAITAGVEMLMTAHVLYPKMDPLMPATLSRFFLTEILRKKMGFQGLIVSDDLDMKALYNRGFSLPEVMVQALGAGVDILLKCEPCEDLLELAETMHIALSRKHINKKLESKLIRLQKFKQRYCLIKPASSFEQLKNIVTESKAHRWCDELSKRRKEVLQK